MNLIIAILVGIIVSCTMIISNLPAFLYKLIDTPICEFDNCTLVAITVSCTTGISNLAAFLYKLISKEHALAI